jgi:hypothetical protein
VSTGGVYRRESNLAISSSPVRNNNVPFVIRAYCYCSKEKDLILILDCVPGISILLINNCTCCSRIPSPSMHVNKHHTSDCTDFVLVLEQAAYYDHRHSRIDEINILQVVKAVEGETGQLLIHEKRGEVTAPSFPLYLFILQAAICDYTGLD